MIALLAAAAVAQCPIPRVAYDVDARALSRREIRVLVEYALCVCGPEGINDAPFIQDETGRSVFAPIYACERYGWDNRHHRYRERK